MRTGVNIAGICLMLASSLVFAGDGNRLAHLEENNPWYPHTEFPKLITPQWIGEDGVEAVVILAIDDMRDSAKYEAYLRPILQRLKEIDGRAPVSIMTCRAKPDDPQLQSWLAEGLSIDVHTVDHPCPLLQGGDLQKAKSTYDRCVDLLHSIPGNRPVAFRMPCCDSLNTVSPRFFEEIFNRTTHEGHYLSISSSVFNVFTSADKDIPRELILDADGNDRFRRYFPKGLKRNGVEHNNFVNWIENYPYPYVINGRCWEFPCMVPSDWEAQFLQQPNSPDTVRDMKAALDITVHKQGVFNLVFHPHGWIKAEQVVELIDHAVAKHGKKVRFLTFREALDRINKNLLAGSSLRAGDGSDAGVRLLDVNDDGFQDVVIGTGDRRLTRIWRPRGRTWSESGFPTRLGKGVQFTLVRDDGRVSVLSETLEGPAERKEVITDRSPEHAWYFDGREWRDDDFLQSLVRFSRHIRRIPVEREDASGNVHPPAARTWRFRDVDHDGRCEAIISWHTRNENGLLNRPGREDVAVFRSETAKPPRDAPETQQTWRRLRFSWPAGSLNAASGNDPALFRFADLDHDGYEDLIVSTAAGTSVALFDSFEAGWSRIVLNAKRGSGHALPEIIRADGSDNGFFIHSDNLCWQNEDTDALPDLIHRVPIDHLLTARLQFEAAETQTKLAPTVMIGAASIDITPEYPIRLSGYGNRTKESEGIAQRINAKALVIGGDSKHLSAPYRAAAVREQVFQRANHTAPEISVLLTVDNCGVPASVTDRIYATLQKRWGIKRERFVVCSSHSHSAPWLKGFAPLLFADVPAEHRATMVRYEEELVLKLTQVIHSAITERRVGQLAWGQGQVTFASNRRNVQAGKWVGFGNIPDGPVDHRLPILVAYGRGGHPIAVLANYACHCTTLTGQSNEISGDWATFAGDFIEEDHRNSVALISIGAGADADPQPRGTLDIARQHGRALADEVKRLIANRQTRFDSARNAIIPGTLKSIDPRVTCRLEHIDLPHGPIPTKEQFEQQAAAGGVQAAHARRFLGMLERGEQIPTVVPDYPVAVWSFANDLAMVFLGGEVVVDYSVRMASEFDGDRLWLSAYSNAMPCYIASKRVLREGGYEADSSMRYYARPTRLAPETEDLIIDTVQKLLPPQFYSEETKQDFPPPKSPAESAAAIQLRSGFRIEVVAAEPLIHDPVAFDWDINGRLWVVEMGDYPNGGRAGGDAPAVDDADAPAGGRIRVLEDTDGDGQYDKAETFLDGIPFPTGIQRWRNGVLVCAAPEIFYAEDSDGDGKADIRKTLYRGFAEGNQQHRVNGLRLGLDNWLHIGNGDSGGDIEAVGKVIDDGQKPMTSQVSISGRDLRIRPDEGLMDPQSGRTQFGRCRDDWGNWFGCNNSWPMWHYVLADHYLRRNPHLAVRDTRQEVPESPGAAPVFPVSRTLARFNDFNKANRFTSACSTMIYRDRLLGEQFHGNAFTCEPVHNLVSRLVLTPDGLSFKGRRDEVEKDSEFLASSDNWFRPVMIRTGPDGALWVADMYRFVIEHPKWIPAAAQRKLNLRAGENLGRIYRIVPDTLAKCCGAEASPDAPKAPDSPSAQASGRSWLHGTWNRIAAERLVQRLASPNGWWRDAAQRILINRQERAVAGSLKVMALTSEQPLARLHALCTLDGLNALDLETLREALKDDDHGVRRHAIRLTEPVLKTAGFIRELRLQQMGNAQTDLQLAYTLGHVPDTDDANGAISLLADLAVRYKANPWMQSAVFSSLREETVEPFLLELLKRNAEAGQFSHYLSQAAAFGHVASVVEPLKGMLPKPGQPFSAKQWATVGSIVTSLRRHAPAWKALTATPEWSETAAQALRLAGDSDANTATRLVAIRLTAMAGQLDDTAIESIVELIHPRSPSELQLVAVAAVAESGRDDVARRLLAGWRGHSPTIRTAIVDSLMQRNPLRSELLNAIERKDIAVSDLDASRREALLTGGPPEIQARAKKLLASTVSSSRSEVLELFRPALELDAVIERGRVVFEKRCAACHKLNGIGKSIGADLAALRDRSSPALLTAILDPNRAVEAKFLAYTAVTAAGRSYSGMLLNESGNSITLIGSDGKEHVLLRSELETLVATNRSLMPEGLEKDVSPQDIADVIAFVQTAASPSKRFAGNSPKTIRPGEDGSIVIPATAAAIYGPTLVFESKYRNLGYWQSKDDYAVWTIELPASGAYDVEIDYACDNSTAGNVLLLSTDGRELRGSVPGTGTWDNYRTWKPGRIELRRGTNRLTASTPTPPQGAMIDLRTIRLKPASLAD